MPVGHRPAGRKGLLRERSRVLDPSMATAIYAVRQDIRQPNALNRAKASKVAATAVGMRGTLPEIALSILKGKRRELMD